MLTGVIVCVVGWFPNLILASALAFEMAYRPERVQAAFPDWIAERYWVLPWLVLGDKAIRCRRCAT